jgi:hypothetical protein
MKTKNEASEFWDSVEKENRATVDFKTYGVFLGKSQDKRLHIPGILYIIGDKFIFENFEKPGSPLRLFTTKEKFEKTKISVALDEVVEVKEVTNGTARACIGGYVNHSQTNPIRGYQRFFSRGVCQVRTGSDGSLFFDLMDSKGFISACQDLGGSFSKSTNPSEA